MKNIRLTIIFGFCILPIVLGFGSIYLAMAFILSETDTLLWEEPTRFLFVFLGGLASGGYFVLILWISNFISEIEDKYNFDEKVHRKK